MTMPVEVLISGTEGPTLKSYMASRVCSEALAPSP